MQTTSQKHVKFLESRVVDQSKPLPRNDAEVSRKLEGSSKLKDELTMFLKSLDQAQSKNAAEKCLFTRS